MLRGPSLLPPKDLIFVIDCSRLNPREFRRLMSRLMLLLASQRRRTFRKFSYRGFDLDALLDMSTDELVKLFPARARRRFQRGLKRKPMALIKKLRNACAHFALCGC